MSGICDEKLDKGIRCTSELSEKNQLDSSKVISDWSQTEDENYEENLGKDICGPSELQDQNESEEGSAESESSQADDNYLAFDAGELMCVLFRKQLYTDVTFCSKNWKHSFSAHRVLLAAKSPFFAELLFGKKTVEAVDMVMTVEISNLPFNIFKNIIEYFYTDKIDLDDVPTLLDTFLGVQYFQVQSIVEKCEACMKSLELTDDNVCSILQMCNERNIEDLRNRCISFIQENTERVIRSVGFEKCIYNTIYAICNLPVLNLNSEEELLDAVLRWAHTHPSHITLHLIKSLLPSIRILNFTASEFGRIIQKHSDIMTADDAVKIIIFLSDESETKNTQNLPEWCNKNMQNRCLKQDNIKQVLKGADTETQTSGKILISLKTATDPQEVTIYSSMLEIECIKGFHQINAIQIKFQNLSENSIILVTVSAKIVHQRSTYNFTKHFSTSSKKSLFKFYEGVRIAEGQTVNITVRAEGAKAFSLYQLDENQDLLQNDHFRCSLSTEPADNKQFIVSQVQYGPQYDPPRRRKLIYEQDKPLFKKSTNDCRFPTRNIKNASHYRSAFDDSATSITSLDSESHQKDKLCKQQRRKKLKKKKAEKEKEVPSFQEVTNKKISSNNGHISNQEITSCTNVKESEEERKVSGQAKKITLEKSGAARNSVEENIEHKIMPCSIEVKYRNTDVEKDVDKDVDVKDEEENVIPECDREKLRNDQENVNQTTLLYIQGMTKKHESKEQEKIGDERGEKKVNDIKREVNEEGNCGTKTVPVSKKIENNQKSERQEKMSGEEKMPESDRKEMNSDSRNNDQIISPLFTMENTEMNDVNIQELIGRRRKEILRTDKKKICARKKFLQIMQPFSDLSRFITAKEAAKKQEETDEGRKEISVTDKKGICDYRNSKQMILPENSIKRTGTENLKQQDKTDRERKEISRENRERVMSDVKNTGEIMFLGSSEKRLEEKDSKRKEEIDGERNEISTRYQKKMVDGGIGRWTTLPRHTMDIIGQENLKQRKEIGEGRKEVSWENRNKTTKDKEKSSPEMLPSLTVNEHEKESGKKQDGNEEETKVIPEKDREGIVRNWIYDGKMMSLRSDIKTVQEGKVGDMKGPLENVDKSTESKPMKCNIFLIIGFMVVLWIYGSIFRIFL